MSAELRYVVENQPPIPFLEKQKTLNAIDEQANNERNAHIVAQCMNEIKFIDRVLADITLAAGFFPLGDTRSEYISWLNNGSDGGRNVAYFLHTQRTVLKGKINQLLGNPIA